MGSISLSTAKHESYINIWRERVMACRSSGKTIVDWCAESHLADTKQKGPSRKGRSFCFAARIG